MLADPAVIDRLSRAELCDLIETLEHLDRKERRRLIDRFYPDAGPLRRELYRKHIELFAAGAEHNERCFLAGNRVGKTSCAAYEITCHLTGEYPAWWVGRRFDRRVNIWAAGEDSKTVRDTVQKTLLGDHGDHGTGMIPGDALKRRSMRGGVPDAVDTQFVQHASGKLSTLSFKSYDQGRESFQGAKLDLVWFDEEPPMDVYTEGLTRVMSTVPGEQSGMALCTFTPLKGRSEVVELYLPSVA